MKRKILAIMLSSMLAFSFTACGNTEETADGTVTNAEADVDVADTGTDVETDVAETDAADIVVDTEAADAQSEDVETDSTEDLFCLLDVPILEMPDLAGTTWSFCGGNIGGAWLSKRVGKNAAPFLPSRSSSSKTVVLPHSPSSMMRQPFPYNCCSISPVHLVSLP